MSNQFSSLKMEKKFKKTPVGEIPVDWEVSPIKSLASNFLNGGTPDTKIERYWNGNIPWITGADIVNQKVSNVRRYITDEAVKNSSTNVVPKCSILVVTRTGVGKLAVAPFDIAISQDITGVIPRRDILVPYFLFWALDYYSCSLGSVHQGTSIRGILREDLQEFAIPFPPIHEQKKIALILSAVDDAIEKTTAVIEKSKELKKGLMQQLLTRGIGHSKFKKTPVGEIPIDWECLEISEITDVYGGSTPDRTKPEYWNGSIRWATPTDVTGNSGPTISSTKEAISESGLRNSAATLMPAGSVLMTSRATLGFAVINAIPMATNQGFANFVCKDGLHNYFFLYLLRWKAKELKRLGAGSTFLEIPRSVIKRLPVPVPLFAEQKKIAEILSAVDDQITQDEIFRQGLQGTKTALMQVLLTGKVRVKTDSRNSCDDA